MSCRTAKIARWTRFDFPCRSMRLATWVFTVVTPIGSWDGVYRYARNRVREMDGSERPAKGLEVDLGEDSGPLS
jgi:hypothetical protein